MNETRMIYRPDGVPVSFEWHGGAYIDVYSMEDSTPDTTGPGNGGQWDRQAAYVGGVAFTCIGVWDYGTDKPSIPVTREAFEAECDEWLNDPENRRDYGL